MATFQPSEFSANKYEVADLTQPALGDISETYYAAPVLVGGAAILLVGPLVVMPFVVKAFKPEWSYGRRVGAGLAISMGLGLVTTLARKAA